MKMIDHKTESVYRRSAIVDEAMLKESALKLAAFHRSAGTGSSKVLSLKKPES